MAKYLIQGRNSKTRLGVEPLTLRSWSQQKRRSKPLRYAADYDENACLRKFSCSFVFVMFVRRVFMVVINAIMAEICLNIYKV